jgi:hypothetical protein
MANSIVVVGLPVLMMMTTEKESKKTMGLKSEGL